MKTIVTLLFVWVLLTLIGWRAGHFIFDSSEVSSLVTRGNPVYGMVTTKDRENHGTIGYIYTINGHQYSGTGHDGSGNPDFDEIAVGQQVTVIYDPENPEKSFLGYPQDQLAANNTGVLFATFVFSVMSLASVAIVYIGLRTAKIGKRVHLN
jgi:hypothetical protein